jgi:ribosomal protein S18 acetylase RimI-like enzyme
MAVNNCFVCCERRHEQCEAMGCCWNRRRRRLAPHTCVQSPHRSPSAALILFLCGIVIGTWNITPSESSFRIQFVSLVAGLQWSGSLSLGSSRIRDGNAVEKTTSSLLAMSTPMSNCSDTISSSAAFLVPRTAVLHLPRVSCIPVVRIRTTRAADISAIATMLASANAVMPSKGFFDFQRKLDLMFAKADIEALLRARHEILAQGRQILARFRREHGGDDASTENSLLLRYLWLSKHEAWHNQIEKAIRNTAEPTVWQQHEHFSLAPQHFSWLWHLQISAIDDDEQAVGFCEVAMLLDPTSSTRRCFAPAIANLAVSDQYRRRGIATRLMQSAEQFVRRKWRSDEPFHLGLYVEKSNTAALQLYRKMGYVQTVSCPGGDLLGEMWYMVRALDEPSPVPTVDHPISIQTVLPSSSTVFNQSEALLEVTR